MANRLPVPGSDVGNWGTVLNNFLLVSLNADGTLNPSAVAAAGGSGGSGSVPGLSTGQNTVTGYYHANAYSGIDRTGAADSTTGINNLIKALPAGGTAYFPAGKYKITGTLATPGLGCRLLGAGSGKGTSAGAGCTTFMYQPGSAGVMMNDPAYCTFQDIQFYFPDNNAASAGSIFFKLNGTSGKFCCVWTNCTFKGQHSTKGDAFGGSGSNNWGTAIYFTNNSGDSQVTDCWFLNMGRAIVTDAIQNYVKGGKFGTCTVGIDVASGNGGMDVSNVTFLGQGGSIGKPAGVTVAHFRISGGTGQSNISQCWFEGADTSVDVTSSPSQLTIAQCKISAYGTCVYIHGGNYVSIMGVQTGQGSRSYDVTVPVYAFGLVSNQSGDGQFSGGRVIPATFVAGSVVEGVKK